MCVIVRQKTKTCIPFHYRTGKGTLDSGPAFLLVDSTSLAAKTYNACGHHAMAFLPP
jgi:hypothetical protein